MNPLGPGSIKGVVDGQLCSGCGLCVALAPHGKGVMQLNAEGFLRPEGLDGLDVSDSERILRHCPGAGLNHQLDPEVEYSPNWGPIVATRVGWSTDLEIRHRAASGGAVSAICEYLVEAGMVDYVVQIGADEDQPLSNRIFQTSSREQLLASIGSRYAPAAPLERLGEQLSGGGRFAVVGKPCDIAAVRSLIRDDPSVKEKIPYLIAFFCAGTPSMEGTRAVLRELQVDEDEVASFVYRGNGWPGYATATLHDGSVRSMDYERSWGGILNRYLQFRCKICPDGTGEFADIACADAWHCDERGYPLFEEQEGRSLVISRSKVGERLVNEAIASGKLECDEFRLEWLEKMQPYQSRRKQLTLSRLAAMGTLLRPMPSYTGLHLWEVTRKSSFLANLKSYLGALRRIIQTMLRRRSDH